ncbi:MAG: CBS domain-containing protein [Thermoanaerobaculaceae bacterium]
MPYRLKLADIMTREVITLSEDDSLADARSCMDRGRIRHLPVVRGKKLVGLVTHRDLLAASFSVFAEVSEREERRLFSQIPVKELMHDAVTAPPDMPVRDAAQILLENKFGCLPVVAEDKELVGIVTEADFLKLTVKILKALEQT